MKKTQAIAEMLTAKSFVLITPKKAILQGQISNDFDGFLQIHSLHMMQETIDKIIKDWEAHHGRDKRGRPKGSRNKQKKVR